MMPEISLILKVAYVALCLVGGATLSFIGLDRALYPPRRVKGNWIRTALWVGLYISGAFVAAWGVVYGLTQLLF